MPDVNPVAQWAGLVTAVVAALGLWANWAGRGREIRTEEGVALQQRLESRNRSLEERLEAEQRERIRGEQEAMKRERDLQRSVDECERQRNDDRFKWERERNEDRFKIQQLESQVAQMQQQHGPRQN